MSLAHGGACALTSGGPGGEEVIDFAFGQERQRSERSKARVYALARRYQPSLCAAYRLCILSAWLRSFENIQGRASRFYCRRSRQHVLRSDYLELASRNVGI